jgi:acetyl-CoA carboxylase biotin carboxylase subunit
MNEYFVGGIKTNLALFRRILVDPDFHAGNFDTGFLDRMPWRQETASANVGTDEVAAVAAGMFTVFGGGNGEAGFAASGSANVQALAASNWRNAGRREALR